MSSGNFKLVDMLVSANLAASKGEAKRVIEQGGVKINGEKVSSVSCEVELTYSETNTFFTIRQRYSNSAPEVWLKTDILLQVGKRKFLKIKAGH